jgi:DNA-binding transcriptional MerR regulator
MEESLEKQIVELRNQGFSYDEIASQLGTNKTKVFRVLRKAGFHETDETIEQELYETNETLEQKFQKMKQEFETFRNTFETHENNETDVEMFQNKIPRNIREHILIALYDIEEYSHPKNHDDLKISIATSIRLYIEFGEDMGIDVFRLPLFKLLVEFYFFAFLFQSQDSQNRVIYKSLGNHTFHDTYNKNRLREIYQIVHGKEYEEEIVEEEDYNEND